MVKIFLGLISPSSFKSSYTNGWIQSAKINPFVQS